MHAISTLNSYLNDLSNKLRIRIDAHMPSFSANKFSSICISGDKKYNSWSILVSSFEI